MQLEHGGIGLFVLVYVYVFFKHYMEISTEIDREVETLPAFMLVLKLSSSSWEVIGTGFAIFLVLQVLIMTCFRALSFASIGTYVDAFPLTLAFGWIFSRRLVLAVIAGTLMNTLVTLCLVTLCRISSTPTPPKPKSLYDYFRVAFIPAVDSRTAHQSLVRAVIVVNLLTLLMVVILAYSNIDMPDVGLPSSAFTMGDYANIITKNRL